MSTAPTEQSQALIKHRWQCPPPNRFCRIESSINQINTYTHDSPPHHHPPPPPPNKNKKNQLLKGYSLPYLILISDLCQFENPGVSPDLHQVLVILEELGTPGGDLPVHLPTPLQVLLVQADLHIGEPHRDHVLLLGGQELGEGGVVPSLGKKREKRPPSAFWYV